MVWWARLDLAHARNGERAYLAALLDSLGLTDEALRTLQIDKGASAKDEGGATLRNLEGMLASRHGQYEHAIQLFEEALASTRAGAPLHTKILANLAAVNMQAGRTAKAAEWTAQANAARLGARDPGIDVLIASVQVGMACIAGNVGDLRKAVLTLSEASRSRMAQLGADHPQTLVVLANLATVEFELACADGSAERRERAIEVLEVASRRLAAEIGADHPQALISTVNYRLAALALAFTEGVAGRVVSTLLALEALARRVDAIMGADHPEAVLVTASVAAAKLALARSARREGALDLLPWAFTGQF